MWFLELDLNLRGEGGKEADTKENKRFGAASWWVVFIWFGWILSNLLIICLFFVDGERGYVEEKDGEEGIS